MNRKLFLLPLTLAAFAATGCMTLGGLPGAGGNTTGGNNNNSGGNNTGGGTSITLGSLIGKVTLTNPSSTGSKVSNDEYTWSNAGCTVRVTRGSNDKTNDDGSQQDVACAVSKSGSYELRCYAGFNIQLECTQSFAGLKFESTTFSDSKYVYDDPHLEDAEFEFDGNITTTVSLDDATTEYQIYAYKQLRFASISFYA